MFYLYGEYDRSKKIAIKFSRIFKSISHYIDEIIFLLIVQYEEGLKKVYTDVWRKKDMNHVSCSTSNITFTYTIPRKMFHSDSLRKKTKIQICTDILNRISLIKYYNFGITAHGVLKIRREKIS